MTWLRRLPPALANRLWVGYLLATKATFVRESWAGASLRAGIGAIVGGAKVCHADIALTVSHRAGS